jgi:hypothetical protein
MSELLLSLSLSLSSLRISTWVVQAIPGVSKIKEGDNPATWMLEASNVSVESKLGVDFAEIFEKSSLYRSVHSSSNPNKPPFCWWKKF